MLSIHLHNIRLTAHHGLYEEEKLLGNTFELDITIQHHTPKLPVKHMSDTIDYVAVYELVKKRMSVPTPLLETVVSEIAMEILTQFHLAEEVKVSIKKLYPPIARMQGCVGVGFELKRSQL